jgi:hypothetical protein
VRVPTQNNFNFNISLGERTQDVLNIQPVISVRVSENWNLITRLVTQIVYQPLPPTPNQPTPQSTVGVGTLLNHGTQPTKQERKQNAIRGRRKI